MIPARKLIGVFGGSGSGKSTLTKMLSRKIPNSKVMTLDPYMHKHWEEHKGEILKAINVNADDNVWWRNYISQNPIAIKKSIDIIGGDIEKDIDDFVKENKDASAIILDWAFIPYISAFRKCDYTICTDSDKRLKIKRLITRLRANNRLHDWPLSALIARVDNSALNNLGYRAKYTVDNSGTLQDLDRKVDEILARENTSNRFMEAER